MREALALIVIGRLRAAASRVRRLVRACVMAGVASGAKRAAAGVPGAAVALARRFRRVLCLGVMLGGALAAGPATATAPLSLVSLRQSDVPGYHAVSPGVESFRNNHDQGPIQAFTECARGISLLTQFDSGPDAVVSDVYGHGRNPFGTPMLSIGSAVFGGGSTADARAAYSALAGKHFQGCWSRTVDRLNKQQGLVVPSRPSTVSKLPSPRLADESAAFAIDSRSRVIGTSVRTQMAITIMRRGPVLVMLLGLAYGKPFPLATLHAIAARLARRLANGKTKAPAPAGACLGSKLPRPTVPVLTDALATTALHEPVTLASRRPGGAVSCQWNGHTLPIRSGTSYRRYQVQLWLSVDGPFASVSAAHGFYQQLAMAFGPPATAAGIGSEAVWSPGQSQVTQQLLVRADRYVFEISLNSTLQQADQRADLSAVAADVLKRLGQSIGTQVSPATWPIQWADQRFCHSIAGFQYLGTTWHGVAACGAPFPNNFQGTIAYKRVVFDTVGFQCVEIAERYFYYVTGLPGPFSNGSNLAEVIYYYYHQKRPELGLYPSGVLGRTSQYQDTLVSGDIISMWSKSDSVAGHVGVVMKVSLKGPQGGKSGTITILNQNASRNGVNTITVKDGRMWFPDGSYPYFQWLYGLPAPP